VGVLVKAFNCKVLTDNLEEEDETKLFLFMSIGHFPRNVRLLENYNRKLMYLNACSSLKNKNIITRQIMMIMIMIMMMIVIIIIILIIV